MFYRPKLEEFNRELVSAGKEPLTLDEVKALMYKMALGLAKQKPE